MTEDAFSFLSKVHPYSSLPRETLGEVSRQVGLQHLLAGEVIVLGEEGTRQALYVVRQGAVQVATDAFVIDTLLPGESFGYESSSSSSLPDGCRATATRDSLLLVLEGSLFQTFLAGSTVEEHLREKSDSFRKRVQEIRQLQRSTRIDPFLRLSLKDVEHRPPVVIGAGTTVAAAVGEMVRRDATSCLVAGDPEVSGIITERDILAKIVARELDPKAVRVESIMSAPLITVRSEALLFEAFSTMVRSSIRKLVVVDRQGRPEGIIEERDLLSVKGENPVHLAAEIASAASTKVLASVFERVNQMAVRSVAEGIGIFPVGRLISDMHDQLLIRICDLVLAGLGEEPPTGFSFLALGSEGRREQYLATDQDNGLVYSDHELAEPFFERFATRFSTALLEVGMPPCPHEVMISNPKWRRSLGSWLEEIDKLIRKADLDSILRISLLMDMRHVAGDGSWPGS
jgi:CBS domain-containing protein